MSESNSQSTGTSQDSIHTEQPVVSSPCVVNITATFNCHVNPSTGSCSIPITPQAQPQPVQPDLPLSLEEQLRVSCEEENSKEALQSVQERGMSMFKAWGGSPAASLFQWQLFDPGLLHLCVLSYCTDLSALRCTGQTRDGTSCHFMIKPVAFMWPGYHIVYHCVTGNNSLSMCHQLQLWFCAAAKLPVSSGRSSPQIT